MWSIGIEECKRLDWYIEHVRHEIQRAREEREHVRQEPYEAEEHVRQQACQGQECIKH